MTKRQRYNRLVRAFKEMKSRELGIPQRQVRIRRVKGKETEFSEQFRQFYRLLTDPKKPAHYRRLYAELGFGRAYWTVYSELESD